RARAVVADNAPAGRGPVGQHGARRRRHWARRGALDLGRRASSRRRHRGRPRRLRAPQRSRGGAAALPPAGVRTRELRARAIGPKIRPKLIDGTFVTAFCDKGRFATLMASIPVSLVVEPRAALLGAARVAQSLL